jgi:molybdate transport system substrate-binding protein
MSRSRALPALTLLLSLSAGAPAARAAEPELLVFAAASLSNVLEELGALFTRETAEPVKYAFAASSALARQLEAGAQADVFLSADVEWMDYVEARGLIDLESRRDLLGNRLVLIAPAASRVSLELVPGFPLAAALGSGRLATGDPDYVPAGRYAKAALTSLGVWGGVEGRLAPAENVRTALAYVARGEAPLGIVYETDARIEPGVRVVAVFPASTHPPITYPVAVTQGAKAGAARFVEFLRGKAAGETFRKFGFVTLP